MTTVEAYAACRRFAHGHYENFPVASWLLPAALRRHVAAIYAFARIADDYADEPDRSTDERLRLLDLWSERLHAAPVSRRDPLARDVARPGANPAGDPVPADSGSPTPHPDAVFVALADTIERFDLPVQAFDDLLSAFRQDVVTTRYETWADLLDYCRRSANPVGRLVLQLSGYRRDDLDTASDAVCTALQLTNFWQDLAIDWSRGRLYVPEETWRPHGADPAHLDGGRPTPEWTAALRECAGRTRALFDQGRPVCDGVSGRLRFELRATWLGGTRILDRLDRSGFDVFTARPTLGPAAGLVIACKALAWRHAPQAH